MALFEVVLQQTAFGQEIINRWNYVSTGTPAAVSLSFALTSALGAIYDEVAAPAGYPSTGLMKTIAAAQTASVTFDQISVRNIYDPVDFYETPFVNPLIGAVAAETAPPFVAFGFRSNRVRTDIRRGMKRFVGVPELWVENGGTIATTHMNGALANIAGAMSETIFYNDEGNTLSFSPVIVSKEEYLPDPLKPDRKAYRYYATLAAQEAHIATGIVWDAYPQVRTQTSRQYGRGR